MMSMETTSAIPQRNPVGIRKVSPNPSPSQTIPGIPHCPAINDGDCGAKASSDSESGDGEPHDDGKDRDHTEVCVTANHPAGDAISTSQEGKLVESNDHHRRKSEES